MVNGKTHSIPKLWDNLPFVEQFGFLSGSASIWVIDMFLHVLAWLTNLSDNQHIN